MCTLSNVNADIDVKDTSSSRVKPATISHRNIYGESTNNVLANQQIKQPNDNAIRSWYAMRSTYGREEKAYSYIIKNGGIAFYPTIIEEKIINGKISKVKSSRIPNIFFIYATEEEAKSFAYDNFHLPYLRFYYGHRHIGANIVKYPIVVPDWQIANLRILCNSEAKDIKIVPPTVNNFKYGESVEITDGKFKGIRGKVSRWHGQQRVGITIDGICSFATAYVPNAFLKKLSE